jgi:hypothetical protein
MPINGQLFSKHISRRGVLVTALAAAPTPVAEVCPIGPAAHEKGPQVWMDMDQIKLDAASQCDQHVRFTSKSRHFAA